LLGAEKAAFLCHTYLVCYLNGKFVIFLLASKGSPFMLDYKAFHGKTHKRILNLCSVQGSDPYYLAHIVIALPYRLKDDYFDDPPETLFCTCIFKVPVTHCLPGILNVYLYRSLERVKAFIDPATKGKVASLVIPRHTLVWVDVY
jgi:hypothetical protein